MIECAAHRPPAVASTSPRSVAMAESSPYSIVAANLSAAPVIGVVRTSSYERAAEIAAIYLEGGLKLIEITFTVPRAVDLVASLAEPVRSAGASLGMGTVTTTERARQAVETGADFIVSPNVAPGVAEAARQAGRYLVLGALTCSEIVAARELGADLVKVYPLPPVGGPAYLEVVRQPLDDIPMLAAGGFGIEEIPAYRRAGAVAFGIGAPLLGEGRSDSLANIGRALELATGGAEG